MVHPSIHPEIEMHRKRCAELRATLKSTIAEYTRLTTEEHGRLMHLYDVNFGAIENTRQQLTLACAELFRRVELLSIKVARGETITPEIVVLINKVVDKEYERLYQRLRDASRIDRERREQQAGEYGNAKVNEKDSAELTSIYRTLAKRLHPDVAAVDDAERRRDWDAVQEAYQHRNLSRLRSLLAMLGEEVNATVVTAVTTTGTADGESGALERLQAEISVLETRVRIEKRRLTRLQSQEPFSIARELDNEGWRHQHAAELEHAVQVKRNELEQHRLQYISLANADVPAHTPVPGSDKNFDSDFMDNTYFGAR